MTDWRQMLTLLEAMPSRVDNTRAYYIESVVIPALLREKVARQEKWATQSWVELD